MLTRASTALTRGATQPTPLLRNGPEQFDDIKIGPSFTKIIRSRDYRMWYEAIDSSLDPDGASPNLYNAIAYALSQDGITWAKQGRLIAPLALGTWENSEICPNAIVWNPVTSKWHLYYHGGNNDPANNRAIGLMTSDTLHNGGIPWTREAGNPILTKGAGGAWDNGFVSDSRVFLVNGTWYMFYCGRGSVVGAGGRIGLATSSDGITWTKVGVAEIFGVGGAGQWDEKSIDSCAVVPEIRGSEVLWHMWYIGRNNSNVDGIGYAWTYGRPDNFWYRGYSNPVLSDATDDDPTDVVEAYYDASVDRFRVYYGQYDLVGQTLRGKGEAYIARPAAYVTPALALLDNANRANDTSPPPGASWAATVSYTNGLHLVSNALMHDGSGNYRGGNHWAVQLAAAGQGSGAGFKLQNNVAGNLFAGMTFWICYNNPATTSPFTLDNGWFIEVANQDATISYISVAPINVAGEWRRNLVRADWFQAGDVFSFLWDGENFLAEHIRGSVKTTVLSRRRTDPRDDTGTAWSTPFPTSLIGQPYWIHVDAMGSQDYKLDEIYYAVTPPVIPTFHGRA